jgi:hypothetical protein
MSDETELQSEVSATEGLSSAKVASCNDLLRVPVPKENQTVVKIETSYWYDKNGAYAKKSIKVLKRKSFGYNLLLEECGMSGAECVSRILNFNEVNDGVYELIVCNISKDWETGQVDDWDLKLIPFPT